MYYLYRFLDNNRRVIYIGKTKVSLRIRFCQHAHLPESCYSKVKEIEFLECSTEADMSMKEIYYINKYRSKGLAEYNIADVSELPQEILIDERSAEWKLYKGSLPDTFPNSINFREHYTEDNPEYIIRQDGRKVRFHQNSKAGQEKFAYPITLQDLENLLCYFSEKMINAQSSLYAFYNFRHIIILAIGVSTPIKGKDLIKLKISDVYDSNGELKPYVHRSRGKEICFSYPNTVRWLLTEYYICLKDLYGKDDDYLMFWGQRDDRKSITADAYAKILTKAFYSLELKTKVSIESLRKTFFRYIFDISENKYEAIACIDFFIHENYRHSPGRMLQYIDVLDHSIEFDPVLFVEGKFIMNDVSEHSLNLIKEALKSLDKT